MMLLCTWFGLCCVISSFVDHYIQSSVQNRTGTTAHRENGNGRKAEKCACQDDVQAVEAEPEGRVPGRMVA